MKEGIKFGIGVTMGAIIAAFVAGVAKGAYDVVREPKNEKEGGEGES